MTKPLSSHEILRLQQEAACPALAGIRAYYAKNGMCRIPSGDLIDIGLAAGTASEAEKALLRGLAEQPEFVS